MNAAAREVAHDRLCRHRHPGPLGEPPGVVAGVGLGPLEGVGPQVEGLRCPQRHERPGPHEGLPGPLLRKDHLPLVAPHRHQLAVVTGFLEEVKYFQESLDGPPLLLTPAIDRRNAVPTPATR